MLQQAGELIIIGGAEDKEGDCKILKEFVRLSGGSKARILVITTATESPQEAGKKYKRIFNDLGSQQVETLDVNERDQAFDPVALSKVKEATGIFFTGGDQLRITSLIGGTSLDTSLHEAHVKGTILAGTSAGASAISATMIVEGDAEEAPKLNAVSMAPGLGLLNDVVIDQHFDQRGRLGRLLTAVAQNPFILGIGIDEDTAIVVRDNGVFSVLGSQAVTVVDGRGITFSNVSEASNGQALALTDIKLHILPAGYKYHLKSRVPLITEKKHQEDSHEN